MFINLMFNYLLNIVTKAPIKRVPFFVKNWKLLFTEPHLIDIILKWYKIQDIVCESSSFKSIEVEAFDFSKRSYALKFNFPAIKDDERNQVYLVIIYINFCNGTAEFIVNMIYPANKLKNINKKYYLDVTRYPNPDNDNFIKGLFKDVEYYYLQSLY